MGEFVPEDLERAASTYRQRNKVYGDNYKRFGAVMEAMFPDGISLDSIEDQNRFGVFTQIVSKLTRYVAQYDSGGHADSLHDIAVYSTMLAELDHEANINSRHRDDEPDPELTSASGSAASDR